MTDNAVQFKDFTFRYDNLKRPTLKGINLTIARGEKVLIAGPSGSGKSTLAHCINGLIPFAYKGDREGSLRVMGEVTKGKSLDAMSRYVGTILQDADGQFVALSVGEDVAFALENDNVSKPRMQEGVARILCTLGMEDLREQSPEGLSGGQKQKVAMAGVLAMESPILLFDEPLANLDPVSGQVAMETIELLHKTQEKTIIVVEHRIEDVLAHRFDRIVVMDKGEIMFNGTPDEALRHAILPTYGLREPLYIEVLRRFGMDLSGHPSLTDLTTLTPYREDFAAKLEAMPEQSRPTAHTGEPLLKVENLRYRYSEEAPWIIDETSFNIYPGEFVAILGNNGAGKSTLLKALTGFCKVASGRIVLDSEDITKASIRKRGEKIGYVMQNPNHMLTKYMLYDEIAFGLRNAGLSEDEVASRVEEVMAICNLGKYRKWPVSALSYGQKRRVAIAAILALRPQVIVLDEPTAGQDHKNYTEFMTFLETLKAHGIAVMMITHDMQLALEYADRGIVLSQGKVLLEAPIEQLFTEEAVLKQANLKPTSVTDLGKWMGHHDQVVFLEKAMAMPKEGC